MLGFAIAAGPVQEEIFENERYQPFKGWGHGWPGNFLPTDRVGHWSHRDGTPGKSASMAFSTVAPKVPKVWPPLNLPAASAVQLYCQTAQLRII